MEFKDLVSLYFERSNAIQTFWNFYLTVIFGLLAFFESQKMPVGNRALPTLVFSLAFAGFAAFNLHAHLTPHRHAL